MERWIVDLVGEFDFQFSVFRCPPWIPWTDWPDVPPCRRGDVGRLPNSIAATLGPVSRFRTVANDKVWATEGVLDVHAERLATSSSKISPLPHGFAS